LQKYTVQPFLPKGESFSAVLGLWYPEQTQSLDRHVNWTRWRRSGIEATVERNSEGTIYTDTV
jgi:hypothetical protein